MNEKLLTAGIGITLGVAIAIGIFFWLSRPKTPPPLTSPTSLTSPTPTPIQQNFIVIDSPADGDVVTTNTITVTGKTSPNIDVVLTSPADDQVVKADANGQFTGSLKIDDGENTVTASIIDDRGTLQLDKKQIILEINE